uniref:Uncharacterized protein n=1 Tax=Guillardia theta TaxID=55529 RepID=A0A7S4KU15_GUITH|mmetsp:Transcript_30592/g.98512  ORF Transcript_30592/g.98512 Transcript_30592/m.98512 type:complete len:708 (+) Transcript_30592:76-2199(+)
MADVLARARELVKNIPEEPASIFGKLSGQISQVVSKHNSENDAESILIHFRELDKRFASFQDHGGWKLERPTPKDLAEHGFFFAPLPGCEDRVACFACGKVLFNWDPNDQIADAHKLFSPNCPLVLGKPVEIPSGVKKTEKPTWKVFETNSEQPKISSEPNAAKLSSFVDTIRQVASNVEADGDLVKRVGKTKNAKKKKIVAEGEFPNAHSASLSDENTASDNDVSSGINTSDQSDRQAAAASDVKISKPETKMRGERLWNFDWSVPSVIKAGLSKAEHHLLETQTSELEIRLATAKKLMKDQQNDWIDAGCCVEKLRGEMEKTNLDKLDQASKKLLSTQEKVESIKRKVALLRDDSLLGKRCEELKRVREETRESLDEKRKLEVELNDLRSQTEAEKEDLEIIRNKQRLTAELDEKIASQQKQLEGLQEAAEEAKEEARGARRDKEEMELSLMQVRDELRDEISELHQQKLAHETSLSEMSEQMLRVKKLYGEYKGRLEELKRREVLCDSRESEVRGREEQVARREATMKTREEWISKRETEFRIQKRALENAQLRPKGSLLFTANSTSPATSGDDASGKSEGGADGYRSEGSLSTPSAAQPHAPDLADRVMEAQAHYAQRMNQSMESAVMFKGKNKAREAAQRDYKAILSTSEKIDPNQDREAAKAARRRDMLMGFIPSKLRGDKKSAKSSSAASAASSLDMNAI